MSRHAPLTDETILDAVGLQTDTIWGCRWGEQTRFAVLDIDETSQYHNELGLARLRHLLASVGLNFPLIYQSSDSEGWHLYLSFSTWVESPVLHRTLKQWLAAEGLEIKQGQLELFPSNNGLRFPLQRGFAWLDDQGAVKLRREDLTTDQAIFKFTDALDANAHNWQIVETRIASRLAEIELGAGAGVPADELKNEDVEEDGFSAFFTHAGMIQEVYNFGRDYWLNGLTAPSQRHHAIICIGHYLWYGDENEGVRALPGIARADQRAAVIEAWLQEKHNGFSKSVLRGDWKEIGTDIRRACNWEAPEGAERQHTSYALTDRAIDRLIGLTRQTGRVWCPQDFQKGNVGREEAAREKIRAALMQLVDSGRSVTVRGLERLSGCKRETIRRHADIWGVFKLSNGPGDLSLLGGSPAALVLGSDAAKEEKVFDPLPSESESLSSELAPTGSMVFDSLRFDISGATANNSTATKSDALSPPPLLPSLATGSNTGFRVLGELVCSLNGFLPSSAKPPLGPLHLPQTRLFLLDALDANLTATVPAKAKGYLVTHRRGLARARAP